MRKILTIATVTFKEMIRQPVYSLVLFVTAAVIYISPWFSLFTLLNSDKLVRDMGLASTLLASILLASFSASGLVFREIENKTALTILSKPIYRLQFLLGKYFGLLAGIFIAILQLTILLILTMRMGVPETARVVMDKSVIYTINTISVCSFIWSVFMNFFFEKPFTSTLIVTFFILLLFSFAGLCFIGPDLHVQSFGFRMELGLLRAGVLMFMAMAILTSISLVGSIKFNMLANMTFCLSIFFVSMTSDYFFGRFADQYAICRFVYHVIPNLQFFWVADAFLNHKTIPLMYMMATSVYASGCVICTIIISWILFKGREIA